MRPRNIAKPYFLLFISFHVSFLLQVYPFAFIVVSDLGFSCDTELTICLQAGSVVSSYFSAISGAVGGGSVGDPARSRWSVVVLLVLGIVLTTRTSNPILTCEDECPCDKSICSSR